MWFLFTIFTILAWSGSDLFSKMGSKSDDKLSHWKMVMAVGGVMGAHALWQIFIQGVEYDPNNIIVYLPVSALYITSMIFGYAGLRYLELSISSPICNSSGAVAAIMAFFLLKETVPFWGFVAIALISVAIFMLGLMEKLDSDKERKEQGIVVERKYERSFLAIFFPVIYCIIDSLGTFMDGFYLDVVMDELNANISYELTFMIMGILAAIYVMGIKKEKLTLSRDKYKGIAAICETAGQFTYVFALSGNVMLAAPAISSYTVFSVVWSHIFLKEKLKKKQYVFVGMVLVGVIILALLDI